MTFLRLVNDVSESYGIHCKRKAADYGHCSRISIHATAFDNSVKGTVSIECRKSGPIECAASVAECYLEERETLGEHAPYSQGKGAVLDPTTFVPAYCGNGRSKEQGNATEP